MTNPNAYLSKRPVSFLYLNKGQTVIKAEPARAEKHIRIYQGEADIVLLSVDEIDRVVRALTRAKNYMVTNYIEASQRESQSIDSE